MIRKIALFWLLVLVFVSVASFVNAQTNYTVPYVDPKILEKLNTSSEVSIIVKVKDTTWITITSEDSGEQQAIKDSKKKEILDNKTNSVLSQLPETEFKLKGKFPRGDGFSGNITRRGLDILINNSDVGEVYLVIIAHIGRITKVNESSDTLKNNSINQSFAITEKEQKSKVETELSEVKQFQESKKKNISYTLMIIFAILSILTVLYLLIKSIKDKYHEQKR